MERHAPWPPRHLLRDVARGVFYKEGGGWTDDPESARDFSDLKELLQFCDQHELRDAEVVEYFGRELSCVVRAKWNIEPRMDVKKRE